MYQENTRVQPGRHRLVEAKDASQQAEVTPWKFRAVEILARHDRPVAPEHRRAAR